MTDACPPGTQERLDERHERQIKAGREFIADRELNC